MSEPNAGSPTIIGNGACVECGENDWSLPFMSARPWVSCKECGAIRDAPVAPATPARPPETPPGAIIGHEQMVSALRVEECNTDHDRSSRELFGMAAALIEAMDQRPPQTPPGRVHPRIDYGKVPGDPEGHIDDLVQLGTIHLEDLGSSYYLRVNEAMYNLHVSEITPEMRASAPDIWEPDDTHRVSLTLVEGDPLAGTPGTPVRSRPFTPPGEPEQPTLASAMRWLDDYFWGHTYEQRCWCVVADTLRQTTDDELQHELEDVAEMAADDLERHPHRASLYRDLCNAVIRHIGARRRQAREQAEGIDRYDELRLELEKVSDERDAARQGRNEALGIVASRDRETEGIKAEIRSNWERIDTLTKQRDAAIDRCNERDTIRLDWLEQDGRIVVGRLNAPNGRRWVVQEGIMEHGAGETVRAAIDAAMHATAAQKASE